MYYVKVDDNNYLITYSSMEFDGYNYCIDNFPDETDRRKLKFYKLIITVKTREETTYDTDNQPVVNIVEYNEYSWEFDQTSFDSSGSNLIKPTIIEKVTNLQNENNILTTKYNQVNTSNGMILLQLATVIASINQP